MSDPLLSVAGLTKRFPGVTALDGVSFDLRPGEIHALCGENGAGKSTLIKVLSGVHPANSWEGDYRVDGAPARFTGVADAEAAGIGVIHQELALVPELSVAENIALGRAPRRGPFIDWLAMNAQARALLGRLCITVDPEARVGALGVGQQQLVEIARALGKRTRVLILDEPTAALSAPEVALLLGILRELRAQGVACIYISHKLEEVLALADRITVLRDGRSVAAFAAGEATRDGLIRAMVGRPIADLFPRRSGTPGDELLRVEDLSADPAHGDGLRLRGISFAVRAGEVLGIGGLMGAGRSELLLHLFGAWGRRRSGRVVLRGAEFARPTPAEAIRRGLVLVSEDRKRLGLVLDQSVGFNLALSSLTAHAPRGLIDRDAEARAGQAMAERLRIKARDLETRVGGLSGGNQQKVVLGKALLTGPSVVLLDEPTRGIDVGAKLEVYEQVNALTAAGNAVVLVSSELPELIGMSDRIVMLGDGRVGGSFARGASADDLLAAAMAASAAARTSGTTA